MIENWTLYLALFSSVILFSQEQLKTLNRSVLQPGITTSVSFKVENTALEDKHYDTFVEASKPYVSPVLTKGELKIPAKESSLYLIPIHVAAETPQGIYTVSLYVTEKETGKQQIISAQIAVAVKHNLSLTTLTSPEYVKAGQPIKVSFLLKNNGNVAEKISLASQFAKITENTNMVLQPSETSVITVTKQTNPMLGKNGSQMISLSANTGNNAQEKITAYSHINVISVNPTEDDVFHRFPITLSLNYLGMRNVGNYQRGYQAQIYGKGTLDKERKDRVEFRAITANPIAFNSFTQYEEYFFSYTRDRLFVFFGDKIYSSSFLTEFARYGRGLELNYQLNKIMIGGFFSNPRFFEDIKTEFNIYSRYEFKNKAEITAGYFRKINPLHHLNYSGWSQPSAHLPYFKGSTKLFKKIEFAGEVAYSQTKNTRGIGYMLQAQGNFKKLEGGIIYMNTSPNFSGYFNQGSTLNGNINYKFSNKISVFTNVVQDVQNYKRDNLLLAAPYRNSAQLGVRYSYNKNGSVFLYSGYQNYQDRMEFNKQFNYKEKFVRASIHQKASIFQLALESQFGKTENYLTNFSGNSRYYTASIGLEKFKTSINIYGSLAQTSRYQEQNQSQVYYGIRTTSHFSDKTHLSLFFQNNYQPEEYYQDRNLLEAIFRQQIVRGHEIDLSGRYTLQHGQLGDKDFIVSLRYTFRLNAPVERTAKYTSLAGNIRNLGVQKTSGVKLNLGNQTSITDKEGNYIFKNMPPGNYFLEIDPLTTDLNDITTINTPISVNLEDKPNTLNFGLTTSASIKGHITYTESKINTITEFLPEKESIEKSSVLLEVSNGEQVFRKICAPGNDFDFIYLRPGDWTVKVYRNGLNKRYKISTETFQFTLEPSETKKLNIEIIEKSKEIKYQQEPIKIEYKGFKK